MQAKETKAHWQKKLCNVVQDCTSSWYMFNTEGWIARHDQLMDACDENMSSQEFDKCQMISLSKAKMVTTKTMKHPFRQMDQKMIEWKKCWITV